MMTNEERLALDPERQYQANPGFLTAFPIGSEPLLNTPADFTRLERFLPRHNLDNEDEPDGPPETDAHYIERAVKQGMIITLSSAEVHEDAGRLRRAMFQSIAERVPLMLVTDAVPDRSIRVPTQAEHDARQQAKLDALTAARQVTR